MNPIILRHLMQARIADLHRPPGRIAAGTHRRWTGLQSRPIPTTKGSAACTRWPLTHLNPRHRGSS
jgi:hypothetical protein